MDVVRLTGDQVRDRLNELTRCAERGQLHWADLATAVRVIYECPRDDEPPGSLGYRWAS